MRTIQVAARLVTLLREALVASLRARQSDHGARGQTLVAYLALAGLVAFACLVATTALAHGAGAVAGP